jgi:hypothetical protein
MVSVKEREILRTLAGKVRNIAELPEMKERKECWKKHNSLKPGRPMVLCFPEGAWAELLPERDLQCQDLKLRGWEEYLRRIVYMWEFLRDDKAYDPYFDICPTVEISGFGVDIQKIQGEGRGSFKYDHPIKNLEKDLERLKFREMSFNRQKTEEDISLAAEIFGDILPVRLKGIFWWTMGLTYEAIKLIGLENMMLYMYDDPDNLHRLFAWLRDEHQHYITWFEENGLIFLNNESDYIASGGWGNTDELPLRPLNGDGRYHLRDLWGFAESQETVGISPSMFNEFVFPYQLPLLERFGLNCYGCCESLHERWQYISRIPNLRRVSVSPWCNQEIMAEALGGQYIFSRKPHPSLVCTGFDENAIRSDLRKTFELNRNGVTEVILKDTHTVQNQPRRLTDWVRIALEEAKR